MQINYTNQMIDEQQYQQEMAQLEGYLSTSRFGDDENSFVGAKEWQQIFGDISPRDLFTRFQFPQGSEDIAYVLIETFPESGYSDLRLKQNINFDNGLSDGGIRFRISDDHQMKLTDFAIRSNLQGQNLGKHYMAAAAQLGIDMEIPSISLTALNLGSYAWAKYGFYPEDGEEWFDIISGIADRINPDGQINYNGVFYDAPEEVSFIQTLYSIKRTDPSQALTAITDLNRVLTEEDGRPITVGKALLIEQEWHGILPLDESSPAFQRFASYTGFQLKDIIIEGEIEII